jgi:hypothetical protein
MMSNLRKYAKGGKMEIPRIEIPKGVVFPEVSHCNAERVFSGECHKLIVGGKEFKGLKSFSITTKVSSKEASIQSIPRTSPIFVPVLSVKGTITGRFSSKKQNLANEEKED